LSLIRMESPRHAHPSPSRSTSCRRCIATNWQCAQRRSEILPPSQSFSARPSSIETIGYFLHSVVQGDYLGGVALAPIAFFQTYLHRQRAPTPRRQSRWRYPRPLVSGRLDRLHHRVERRFVGGSIGAKPPHRHAVESFLLVSTFLSAWNTSTPIRSARRSRRCDRTIMNSCASTLLLACAHH